MTSRQSGFTLIELMMVVVLAGIMAVIGLPSFRDFVEGQRIKTASSDFFAAALYARSEAIKRNAEVEVAAATGGWVNGWVVQVTASGLDLDSRAAFTGLTFTLSPDNSLTVLKFGGNGRLTSAATTFVVTGPNTSGKRCVAFDLSGMPKGKLGGDCP